MPESSQTAETHPAVAARHPVLLWCDGGEMVLVRDLAAFLAERAEQIRAAIDAQYGHTEETRA